MYLKHFIVMVMVMMMKEIKERKQEQRRGSSQDPEKLDPPDEGKKGKQKPASHTARIVF